MPGNPLEIQQSLVYVVIVNFSEWMLLGPGNVLWVAFVCMMILLRRDSKLAEGADVE